MLERAKGRGGYALGSVTASPSTYPMRITSHDFRISMCLEMRVRFFWAI